ncbi:hypothetical protein Yalta_088 [Yalta virus]|nr:hypothetical protein Yalta_088 [Yalta virus]
MILNLLTVVALVVVLIYLFSLLQESMEYHIKELINTTLRENKEHDERISKLQSQMILRRKEKDQEDEKKIYSLIEIYMKKNKLDCPKESNHSEE